MLAEFSGDSESGVWDFIYRHAALLTNLLTVAPEVINLAHVNDALLARY